MRLVNDSCGGSACLQLGGRNGGCFYSYNANFFFCTASNKKWGEAREWI